MPSPFLARTLVSWLAARASAQIEQTVVDELKSRVESGDLGDYDGILFKNPNKKQNSADNASDRDAVRADVGVVGATKQELVGMFDKMGVPKATKGDKFKYYTGNWRGKRVAIVEAGVGVERAKAATEALIQVFRPTRVVSAGFAAGLTPTLESGALVVPNRLILEATGREIDLSPRALADERGSEPQPEPGESVDNDGRAESADSAEKTARSDASKRFESSFLDRLSTGTLLTVDRIVRKPNEKRRLGEETGATILDMESFAVAEVCASAGVPFLPIRVVFDACDESLPREIQNVVDASQSPARLLGALFGAVSKRPSSVVDAYKLKERSLVAADKLAAVLDVLLASDRRA